VAERPARRPKPTPAERREQRAAVDDPGAVLEAAARLLEARSRSEAEVRRRLTRAGYRADLVEDAVGRLLAMGYLDDEAFTRAWVESRDRAHPRGEHALRRELGLKGIDKATVDAVLGERRDDAAVRANEAGEDVVNPDEDAAERLLEKKLPSILREADPRRRRQRAYALLARNGFAPDVCATVSKRVLAAPDADGAEEEDGAEEGEGDA